MRLGERKGRGKDSKGVRGRVSVAVRTGQVRGVGEMARPLQDKVEDTRVRYE